MSLKKTDSAGNKPPIPHQSLNMVFDLIIVRKIAEAEKLLQEIEINFKENIKSDFDIGFIRALKGIILMYKSGDQSSFLNNLNLNDAGVLRKYYSEFLEFSMDDLHSNYDRGYFSALSQFMLFALRKLESRGK
ncbi:MAG: hypothetical protein QXW55_04235 [Candidatus Bathyarchaeia archaeon]